MNRLNTTHAWRRPGIASRAIKRAMKKFTDRHQSKQEKISATTFIIEVIGKQGDKQQTRRRPALQQQINQYKSDKQPEENTIAECHWGLPGVISEDIAQTVQVYIQSG